LDVIRYKQSKNGLDPYKYLIYLSEHLPNLDLYRQPELLEAFLPWTKDPQQYCAASPTVQTEVANCWLEIVIPCTFDIISFVLGILYTVFYFSLHPSYKNSQFFSL